MCVIHTETARCRPKTATAHWKIPKSITSCKKYYNEKGEPILEVGILDIDCKNKLELADFVNMCKICTPQQMIEGPYSKLYARYRSLAGEVNNQFENIEVVDGDLQNEWYYGIAGSGKSHKA